ncbi:MAG: hypothetical protein KBA82_04260 [Nitrosomonas sp.]|nr:hypothetical protein [Nitrosomonas sp.]MBP7112182.1 hypothetical protein [Nitrosomonas sp.]
MQKESVVQSVVICALLSACASPMQQSSSLSDKYLIKENNKGTVRGIPYYLPDTVIPIKVSGDFQVLPDRKPKDPKINPNPQDYEYVLTFTIDEAKQIPDPTARLLLEYNLSMRSSDEFRLAVTKNGLLNTVKSLSEDKTGEVIVKLAELAKEGIKIGTTFSIGVDGLLDQQSIKEQSPDERRKACYSQLKKMSVSHNINASDFLNPIMQSTMREQVIAEINSKIVKTMITDGTKPVGTFNLISNVDFKNKTKTLVTDETPKPKEAKENDNERGIVFRVMEPANLQVTMDTSNLKFEKSGQTCTLPHITESVEALPMMVANPSKTYVVDTNRAVFVKKRVDLIVSDGVLTGIDVDKPSELLAGISIPVEVLKTIASIPGEILSLKVKGMEAEKSLTTGEAEIIKQQVEIIKQRQALSDIQK